MYLYMHVSNDKYELPLAVAESVGELARMTGRSPATISSSICHRKANRYGRLIWLKVEVDDEQE